MNRTYLSGLFLILCFVLSAQAATTMHWSGAKDRVWTDPNNWDVYDPCGSTAYIDANAGNDPCVNMDTGAAKPLLNVYIGAAKTTPVSLEIADGGYLRLSPDSGWTDIGQGANSNGYLKMTGGTINGYRLYLADASNSYGQFDMTGGTVNIRGRIRMGSSGTSHAGAVWNMSDGTVAMTDNPSYCEYICVGWNAGSQPAVFNFSNGTINVDAFTINRNGNGIFNMTGGTLNCLQDKACIYIGEHGDATTGQGVWNLSGGYVTAKSYVGIGYKAGTQGPAILNMTGGIIDTNNLIIGMAGEGIVNLSGGTITVNYFNVGSPGLVFNESVGGDGLLNMEDTGELIWAYGDHRNDVNAFITAGYIVAYNGSGTVLVTYSGGHTYVTAEINNKAYDPVPDINEIVNAALDTLEWTNPYPGETVYCDVYFGPGSEANMVKIVDYQDVNSVAVSLSPVTKYYWRVDTNSVAHPTKITGVVWTFTTSNAECTIGYADGDLNGDCWVNFEDFAIIAGKWMSCGWDISTACD